MSFNLESTESVAAGVRRIAHEQFTGVSRALTEGSGNRDDDIHSARKAMKRMRGLLRLIRGQLSTDEYRSENGACRDAARKLAGLRDATVLVATLDSLATTADDGAHPICVSVRQMLEERRRAAYDDGAAARDGAVAEVLEHVLEADARVDSWPLKHAGWKMVNDGLLRMYRRGRSEFDACSWQPSTERLHQWRKRVKYLYYQMQILQPMWPGMMAAWQEELDRLGDLLGDDHDLAVLAQKLREENPCTDVGPLLIQISHRRYSLQRQALILGMRLFGERPRDWSRRWHAAWRAWQEECIAPDLAGIGIALAPEPATPPGATPERMADTHCKTGEGPLWHSDESCLYWVDIPAGILYRLNPVTSTHEQVFTAEVAIGGFTIQADGSLLLFLSGGAIAVWRQNEHLEYIIEGITVERESRFNDVIADPMGRVYCGTMAGPTGGGRLFRLDTDGSLTELLDGVGCSNGMGFSPDRRHLYYIDSSTRKIDRFDWDKATGDLRNRQVFVDTTDEEGVPDGMTVDAEGFVWCARWDGSCLVRYRPDGIEQQRIEFPARKVSSVTFGGADLDVLYVTTAGGDDRLTEGDGAGALFSLRPGVRGLPEFRSRVCL